MNEPLLQADTQAGESGLWDKAPGAWRRLTVVASLLTLAAVATPLLLSQPGDTRPLAWRRAVSGRVRAKSPVWLRRRVVDPVFHP